MKTLSMNHFLKTSAVSLGALTLAIACQPAEKRGYILANDKSTADLLGVTEYKHKEFGLTVTGNLLTSDRTEDGQTLVTYATEAKLVGQIPIKAKKGAKYVIIYNLNDDGTLTVSKSSAPEDSDKEEAKDPETRSKADGTLDLKLLTYDVEYYKMGPKKNADGEETKTLIGVKTDRESATHFKVKTDSVVATDAVTGLTSFATSYFDGTWSLDILKNGKEDESLTTAEEKSFSLKAVNDQLKSIYSSGEGANKVEKDGAFSMGASVKEDESKTTQEKQKSGETQAGTITLDLASIKHSKIPNTYNVVNFELDQTMMSITIQDKTSPDRYTLKFKRKM